MSADAFPHPSERVLRLPEVVARVGLRRSSVYAAVAAGTFPAPIKLTPTASGWLQSEVADWIARRVQESRKAA